MNASPIVTPSISTCFIAEPQFDDLDIVATLSSPSFLTFAIPCFSFAIVLTYMLAKFVIWIDRKPYEEFDPNNPYALLHD